MDRDLTPRGIGDDFHLAVVERERMTQRDQIRGALGTHNPSQARRLEQRPLAGGNLPVAQQRRQFARQGDARDGVGEAAGDGLRTDVHHRGTVRAIEMGKRLSGIHQGKNGAV